MSTGAFTLADIDKPAKGRFSAADVDSRQDFGEGTTVTGKAQELAAKALQGAGLPTSLANVPDWFRHLTGTAKDSEPWWSDIREAIKNPTQENLTKAVPLVGPMSVSMAKDVEKGQYGDAAATLAGGLSSVLAAGQVKPGLGAAKTELAEATRNPDNSLTPATRATARAAATAVGSTALGPGGGVAGALGGPAIADAVLPNRLKIPDFHEGAFSDFEGESGKAVPVSRSPEPGGYRGPTSATLSAPGGETFQPGGKIQTPLSPPPAINKTLVSYDRNLLVHMARGGDLNALRELIRNPGGINVAEAVPNSKYLLESGAPTRIYGGPGSDK